MELPVAGFFPVVDGDGIVAGNQGIISVLIECLLLFLREKVVFVSFAIIECVRQELEAVDGEAQGRVFF